MKYQHRKHRAQPGDPRAMTAADWQLAGDVALVWRDGAPACCPAEQATDNELATGIGNIEGLAVSILDGYLRRASMTLTHGQRQEAIGHLIGAAWQEAVRFNGKGRLGGFVTSRLRWRLVDWMAPDRVHRAGCHEQRVRIEPIEEAAHVEAPATDTPFSGVNLLALSAESWVALNLYAEPLSHGITLTGVARQTGHKRVDIESALDVLAGELLALGVEP